MYVYFYTEINENKIKVNVIFEYAFLFSFVRLYDLKYSIIKIQMPVTRGLIFLQVKMKIIL